jgi:alpha-L-rhamnosidase
MGATTIWERWDGMKPDSTFQTPGMNSFNHYAYGAIGDWMYRTVTGIRETEPGYQKMALAPQPGGKLTQAGAELQTPYGLVQSSWKIESGTFSYDVTVPPNTSAEVILPKASDASVTEQKTALSRTKLVNEKSGEDLKVRVGSGSYHFEYPWK